MSSSQSILWYDLETFGTNPQYDRIAQYAAVRTNLNLEQIEEPKVLYCRITQDYLPDPLACLITGITPQQTLEEGLKETEFIQEILADMMVPGTCTAGFNSISFDDEFIRNTLYRNLFDPYEREYVNGNSRWDIIDLLRAAHDLRPEGIHWPKNEQNKPSFRLESITEANGIEHAHAHDALADVYATISAAKLVRTAQPDLYDYAFNHRKKRELKELVDVYHHKPFLHTSARYTNEQGCTALVMPLVADPHNSNALLCVDLSRDPEQLIHALPEQLRSEGMLVRIALNKSPFISPASVLTDEIAERLGIDKELCRSHYSRIMERGDLTAKIHSAFSTPRQDGPSDPDFQIYSGGFFSDYDKDRFEIVHSCEPEKLLQLDLRFEDARAPELLWRYICRNYPEILPEKEKKKWLSFAAGRLLFPPGDVLVSYQFFTRKVAEKARSKEVSSRDKLILKELEHYGNELKEQVLHAM
ncbi:MAG: exodeoxyribonuclease I [Spirochaetota bacterium]